MYVIRNTMYAKPGRGKELIEKLKAGARASTLRAESTSPSRLPVSVDSADGRRYDPIGAGPDTCGCFNALASLLHRAHPPTHSAMCPSASWRLATLATPYN
jgi:hypothetical protein